MSRAIVPRPDRDQQLRQQQRGGLKEKTATCPSGKKVVGGGAQPISSPAYYAAGYPVGDNAFHAIGSSPAGPAFSVRAFAFCATVAG